MTKFSDGHLMSKCFVLSLLVYIWNNKARRCGQKKRMDDVSRQKHTCHHPLLYFVHIFTPVLLQICRHTNLPWRQYYCTTNVSLKFNLSKCDKHSQLTKCNRRVYYFQCYTCGQLLFTMKATALSILYDVRNRNLLNCFITIPCNSKRDAIPASH